MKAHSRKVAFLDVENQNKWKYDPNHPINKLMKKYEKDWIKK